MSGARVEPSGPDAPSDDAVLVRRVLAGHRDDYRHLVKRHQASLFRHVRAMGMDHDTASDLVQDALVAAYERLRECRDPRRFRAWVYRIVRNRCLDHLKSAAHQRSVRLDEAPAEAVTERAGHDVRTDVLDALDRLSPELREAFWLKHAEGVPYDEMADRTGCSVSALKMRVHRARESLSELLTQAGRS